MQRKTELYSIGAVALLLIAMAVIAALVSGTQAASPARFNATVVPAVTAADHARGDTAGAKVSVIEYGDFQCPACGQYEPIMEQLTAAYGSRVEFVFRNFPLYQIHPNAMIAAQAAEAAGLQGKYWGMHDLLYKRQNDWADSSGSAVVSKYFDVYAGQIGLNVAQFDADINGAAVKNKIQHDMDTGNGAQIDHTPTFFIDLAQIPNPNSLQEFQKAIDAALASSSAK